MSKLTTTSAGTEGNSPITATTDSDFASQFAAKLDALESEAEGNAGEGNDAGSTTDASSGADAESEDQASDGSTADPGATEHDDEDADETEEGDEQDDDSQDAGEADDDAAGEASDDATAGEEDDAEHADDADDEEDTSDAGDTELAAQVRETLERSGLKLTLKDLPANVRPLVQKKLDHANAAVTRALQEATGFRKERAQFLADQRYRDEHPELAIAELLDKHPELAEKVNELVEKNADPDKKKLFEITVRESRQAALNAITSQESATERKFQRADEIESYTRRACAKVGIPKDAMSLVEESIAHALLNKPEEQRDLNEDELDAIITRHAKVFRRTTRENRRQEQQRNIRERKQDRKTTSPAVRAGNGVVTPAPAGRRPPKSDAEFVNHMVAKLG